jgi:hypothetical protein
MTIDSSWLQAFKEEMPHAFTPKPSFRQSAVFIDGQIKLMQSPPAEPQSWDQFIFRQYARSVGYFLESCDTVVLAFDNYEHVPLAKCMTQTQRRRNIPVASFSETCELPPMVPEGQFWTACISNRTFKTRVIELIILRLPALVLSRRPGKRLIIDYRQPVQYVFDTSSGMSRTQIEELEPMGEADVKFTRYADRFGSLLVDSIDGDSIPIALMHHERCLRSSTCPPMVSVYRMELRVPGEEKPAQPQKRRAGASKAKSDEPPPEPETAPARRKAPRTYEYVDIHALYEGLRTAIAQSVGRITLPMHRGHEMAMLVSLIALTGTDFSRHLPQISGRTVYGWLPYLWMTLTICFDPASDSLLVSDATNRLVALIYRQKFPKHATSVEGLGQVLAQLSSSAISQRVKDSLPSAERVACTVQNANWLLAYWTCLPAPDPIQPCYGFRLINGRPQYAE